MVNLVWNLRWEYVSKATLFRIISAGWKQSANYVYFWLVCLCGYMVQATLSVVFVSRWLYLAEVRMWMVWCVFASGENIVDATMLVVWWSESFRSRYVVDGFVLTRWHHAVQVTLFGLFGVFNYSYSISSMQSCVLDAASWCEYIYICLSYLSHTLVLRQCAKSNIHFAKQQTRSLEKVDKYFKHNHHKCMDFCCRTWGHFNWPCQDKVDICSLK